MKTKISFIILSSLLLLFVGCKDELTTGVNFSITAVSDSSRISADTLIVKKLKNVTFNFDGTPDFITFYSGEAGHEYNKRDLIYAPTDSSKLSFTSYALNGTIPGTLKVYLSTSLTGLIGVKSTDSLYTILPVKKLDSISVASTNWIDITDSCHLVTASGTTSKVVIRLNSYIGKRITLAFKYKTTVNTETQPSWEIRSLKIVSKYTSGDSLVLTPAAIQSVASKQLATDITFRSLDILDNTLTKTLNPYTSSGIGRWNLPTNGTATSPTPFVKLAISSTGAGLALNEDWLVSNPIPLNERTPDTGVGVKIMSLRVPSYSYSFSAKGVYKVTFVAQNNNSFANSSVVKTVVIKVE